MRSPFAKATPGALCIVAALFLAGCSTTAGVAAIGPAPAAGAAPCASCASAQPAALQTVQVVSAPQVAANGVQYVQVQYRVGASEWARAGLAIPGNVVVCFGNFLRCAMEALFPIPTPSAQLVAAPAPQAVQVVPAPAAAPCAPVAPSGRWEWKPAAMVEAPADKCPGGVCVVPDGFTAGR